jgi:hypothetical protein
MLTRSCITGIMRTVTKGNQSNLGILIPDGVKTEATLGVIQKPVVFIGLGNGNDICRKKYVTNQ